MPETNDSPYLLTTSAAADRLRISERSLFSAIKRGDIATVKIGGAVRISSSEVARIINNEPKQVDQKALALAANIEQLAAKAQTINEEQIKTQEDYERMTTIHTMSLLLKGRHLQYVNKIDPQQYEQYRQLLNGVMDTLGPIDNNVWTRFDRIAVFRLPALFQQYVGSSPTEAIIDAAEVLKNMREASEYLRNHQTAA